METNVRDRYIDEGGEISGVDALSRGLLSEVYDDNSPLGKLIASMLHDGDTYEHFRAATTDPAELFKIIAEVINPRGEVDVVRWVGQERMSNLSPEQNQYIFEIADMLGMRIPKESAMPRVEDPLVIVESGANRTSVVRRGLAEEMLNGETATFYQFGSVSEKRTIHPERYVDKKDKDGNVVLDSAGMPIKVPTENKEYKVISDNDICGDLGGQPITEFDVNRRSAITAGYEQISDDGETVTLKKDGLTLRIVRANSFKEGLGKIADKAAGRNIVIATNRQYCPKDEVQADRIFGDNVQSITTIGDETGTRGANIYRAEIGALFRVLVKP